eukprot:4427075-Pleurochrysis_carterae.AAC.1
MSTCSALPSMVKRDFALLDTGDSKVKLPPRLYAAIATSMQLLTIALARVTVAGRPPSVCDTPIGYSDVRSTCESPGAKRAADQVEHGGDATTATQSVSDASSATRLATSS